jgi:VWFA-related protein
VSVLDRNRQPVRGLRAEDFTILEDGEARTIAAFAELHVKAPRPVAARPALVDRAAPDVHTNEIARTPEGRLFVLVLDDAMIPKEALMVATARKIAATAIDRMSPDDQMAVVFTVNSRGAQNFTGDRTKLLRAVDTFSPGYATHVMGWDLATFNQETGVWERQVDGDDGYRAGAIRTLEMVAESLIAAPQRRKAIIFVSTGVFADADGAATPMAIAPGRSMMIRDSNASLVARLPPLFRRMREANVAIYSVDPAGLGGLESYVLSRAAGIQAINSAKRNMSLADDWFNPTGPPMATDLSRKMAAVNLDFLKTAATNTGGLAITDTNDLSGGIGRIFDENSSYYLLGFGIPPGHRPGSRHRLEVRVNRPEVVVLARRGAAV